MKKVLVAMSGGVDSSVAAALLKEKGYDVVGVTLGLWDKGSGERGEERGARSCCSISAVDDAKRVAAILGIPHYTLNFRKVFKDCVIKDFISEYRRGRTPNPCIRCNEHIKFRALLKKADELGADFIATGHYARINEKLKMKNEKRCKVFSLLKGRDKTKDQSYVLYMLDQRTLSRVLFPLGNLTKKEVRKLAKKFRLPVADKEESQEICFVPNDDYKTFLKAILKNRIKPGPIVDLRGKVIGKHHGIEFYTIGQRRGLGISNPAPLYVVSIDPKKNAIVVGEKKDVMGRSLIAAGARFVSGKAPSGKLEVKAKIRYNAPQAGATLNVYGRNKVKVEFRKPQHAITPGQSVVFYDGDAVVGGGVIERRTG